MTAAILPDLGFQIISIREVSVLLDTDLAALYRVSPSALMQAVRRNARRFPSDFMFQLTDQEVATLKSQFVISKRRPGRGGRRTNPYAFTEQGVAMLSSVLRSDTAALVNIQIMRAFVRLRIGDLVEAIRQLAAGPPRERSRPIGFTADLDLDEKDTK